MIKIIDEENGEKQKRRICRNCGKQGKKTEKNIKFVIEESDTFVIHFVRKRKINFIKKISKKNK